MTSTPLKSGAPALSFEFFPPKDETGEERLWQAMTQLACHRPDFVSVTYGAGGSGKEHTARLVCQVRQRHQLTAMAHLTCVGESEANLRQILDHYRENGITHILALRGDVPRGASPQILEQGAFRSSIPFVAFIRRHYPEFRIGVAAYPEKHPEAPDMASEIDFFRRKVDAGADFALTQFFFDNGAYFRFMEASARVGVEVPVLPGLIPVTDYKQLARFAQLCGAALPDWLVARMEGIKDDPAAVLQAGVEVAVAQCLELLKGGVPGLHFFTLNRADAVQQVINGLASSWTCAR